MRKFDIESYRDVYDSSEQAVCLIQVFLTSDEAEIEEFLFLYANRAFNRVAGYDVISYIGQKVYHRLPDNFISWAKVYYEVIKEKTDKTVIKYSYEIDKYICLHFYPISDDICGCSVIEITEDIYGLVDKLGKEREQSVVSGRESIVDIDKELTISDSKRFVVASHIDIINKIPVGMGIYQITSNDIKKIFINKGYSETFGNDEIEENAYLEDDLFNSVFDEDRTAVLICIDRLREGDDKCDFIFRYKYKDNDIRWIRMVGNIGERIGDKIVLYASFINVTERINVQRETEKSRKLAFEIQKRQKELFDTVPSGILEFAFFNDRIHVISVNHTLIAMLGYEEEEFHSRRTWYTKDVVHPDDLGLLSEVRENTDIYKGKNIDFRLYNKKTGLYRWISCDFTVTSKKCDNVIILAAFLDIDDKRKLEDVSAAKSRFLSRMSHDMRTPMNGIIGMTRIMQDIPDLQEEAKECLDAISESGNFLLGLINDTLEMSRIESNKFELHFNVVNAEKLIKNILSTVGPLANEKNIEFSFIPINVELSYIKIDRIRIQQIFINIFSNAIKFTPEGGRIILEIECLGRENGIAHVRISIEDNGIGMSEDFIEHVFEPYTQEREYTGTGMVGTGLGLSIVQKLVEILDGKIEITSKKNMGTRVTIYMDFEKVYGYEDEPEKDTQTDIKALKGMKVLFVEDHPMNTRIGMKLLEKVGAVVDYASDGKEGLNKYLESIEGYYDLVLMDIRMPIMDGVECTRQIRESNRSDSKSIAIVAMTANAYDTDVRVTKNAGMNEHLSKPIEPDILYTTMLKYAN